jgi:hypothetical protein
MQKYYIKDKQLKEKVRQYKQALRDAGFSERTVETYIADVNKYIASGGELKLESVDDFFSKVKMTYKGRFYPYRACVRKFIRFINGENVTKRPPRYVEVDGVKKYISRCDHDCFNCKYEDCLLPA